MKTYAPCWRGKCFLSLFISSVFYNTFEKRAGSELGSTFPCPAMKSLALALLSLISASAVHAADARVVAMPDLKSPLPAEWAVQKGTWEVKDGVITAAELPDQKHAAVLWHKVPLQAGAVECEFMLDGAKVLILGCDGDKHVGRVVITPTWMRILDDSTEVKGKTPSTKLAETKLDLKPGQWYTLRYEWDGDRMAATLGDKHVEGANANLAKKKARWWFAVSGQSMKIRNVKVTAPVK